METILNGAGQPVVVGNDKNNHGCSELVSCGQMHDEARHNDHSVRSHALHVNDVQERFGLRQLEDLACVRRELNEIKHELSLKMVEDGFKTRDLLRDLENSRMRSDLATLRAQLIAAGLVPSE